MIIYYFCGHFCTFYSNRMKKTTQLRSMIASQEMAYLMEAHNGLSAKIAEEAGFKGIWGSGLSISAALGVKITMKLPGHRYWTYLSL